MSLNNLWHISFFYSEVPLWYFIGKDVRIIWSKLQREGVDSIYKVYRLAYEGGGLSCMRSVWPQTRTKLAVWLLHFLLNNCGQWAKPSLGSWQMPQSWCPMIKPGRGYSIIKAWADRFSSAVFTLKSDYFPLETRSPSPRTMEWINLF